MSIAKTCNPPHQCHLHLPIISPFERILVPYELTMALRASEGCWSFQDLCAVPACCCRRRPAGPSEPSCGAQVWRYAYGMEKGMRPSPNSNGIKYGGMAYRGGGAGGRKLDKSPPSGVFSLVPSTWSGSLSSAKSKDPSLIPFFQRLPIPLGAIRRRLIRAL